MSDSKYTEAQKKALETAWDALTEHFDGVILGVTADVPTDTGEADYTRFFWHGGFCTALGMFLLGQKSCESTKAVEEKP